ncbi:MAG: flagellar hook-associated protein FlgL [Candidatus Omnitrophica bacterium]|nr:flagellar hook-associated protein FlgL [Candidatus Omnitrophota bacterium]
MRITQSMLTRQYLNDVTTISEKLAKYQTQIASGKKIERPSDDPVGIPQLMTVNTNLAEITQHQDNIKQALYWLDSTSLNLGNAEDAILEVSSLGNKGLSGLLTAEERSVIADQVDQYLEDVLSYANATVGGKYVFGGTQLDTAPFIAQRNAAGEIVSVSQNPNGIDQDIRRNIGANQTVVVNSKGGTVFQPAGAGAGGDIFEMIAGIRDALRSGDLAGLSARLTDLDTGLDQVVRENSNVGTKINRLNFAQERLNLQALSSHEQISALQDTDYVEVLMKYQTQQNIFETALSLGSRLLQNSLVNYL